MVQVLDAYRQYKIDHMERLRSNHIKAVLALILSIGLTTVGFSQDKQAKVKSMVEAKHYEFVAQSAMPMSGPVRQLTSEYDLKVSSNSVDAYLPYFGRAYQAPTDPTKGGIEFSSKNFGYHSKPSKKGW